MGITRRSFPSPARPLACATSTPLPDATGIPSAIFHTLTTSTLLRFDRSVQIHLLLASPSNCLLRRFGRRCFDRNRFRNLCKELPYIRSDLGGRFKEEEVGLFGVRLCFFPCDLSCVFVERCRSGWCGFFIVGRFVGLIIGFDRGSLGLGGRVGDEIKLSSAMPQLIEAGFD